jgi:hypothetical protein
MDDNNGSWNPKVVGIFVALALGAVLVFAGALNAFIVALFILVGWIIGKYIAGELDLDDRYDRYIRDRTRKRKK